MIEGNKFEKLNVPCTNKVGFVPGLPVSRFAANAFPDHHARFLNTCMVEKSIWLPRISRLR